MAAPSVTYSDFVSGTTIDPDQVDQNFTDVINALTDGSKDLTINALTCQGAVTLNGNITLGNATGDSITVNGRFASDLDPSTAASQDLGSATLPWKSLHVDNTSTDGGAIYFDGGTTEFLKALADGTRLDTGGFTSVRLDAAALEIYNSNSKANINSSGVLLYMGNRAVAWVSNLSIQAATTTNANDSIKLTGATAALSASNPGYIGMIDEQNIGQPKSYALTSDITLDLTGCTWGNADDITDGILDVVLIDDAGTIKMGVSYYVGSARQVLGTTEDETSQASVTAPEDVFVNSALGADCTVIPFGWFKYNYDHTGGAAEKLYAIQTSHGDLNYGSSDGIYRPWNPTYVGFSSDPSESVAKWTMYGRSVHVILVVLSGSYGTSNSTNFDINCPIKAKNTIHAYASRVIDNGSSSQTGQNLIITNNASTTFDVALNDNSTGWTATGDKAASFNFIYEAN